MLDSARVGVVVKPLDRALTLLKLGVVPAIAIAVSLPEIQSALGSSPTIGSWVVGFAGSGIAVAYIVLVQMNVIGARMDHAIARLRRRIAVTCDHDYATGHEAGGIACLLTPEAFQVPIFRYERQTEVVESLTTACEAEQAGMHWFIEGGAGTGKTRTALRLVQALVRDRSLCDLGSRCYLYDLSRSDAMEKHLLRKLRRRQYEGAVVLVDNFQRISSNGLREMTDLLDRRESRPAHVLVFFTRPGEAWNLDPGSDVRLLSEAKSAERYEELRGPRSQVVEDSISRFDSDASELVRELKANGTASAAQLHLAQVVARNRSMPRDVHDTLNLLLANKVVPSSPDLTSLLGVLAALSMHRGSFSREELHRAIRVVAPAAPGGRFGFAVALRLHASFRRLRRIGLVGKIDLDGASYVFHEEVAELCIDRLSALPEFHATLVLVGRSRLEAQRSAGEALEPWMTATEIGEQDVMLGTFEGALAGGANNRMASCLERARGRYELDPATQLQLAVLLDRRGEFVASRAVLADGLLAKLAPDSDLAVLLAASRVEANHPGGHEADLQVLLEHPDPLVSTIGRYWEAHVATHRGEFDSDRMLELASEALPLVKTRGRFWQVHSLGRAHFDSLRAFYLAGRSDFKEITSPARRALDTYLEGQLPTFEAMHALYRYAHLVSHVLLPRQALLGERVSAEDAAYAGLELGRDATVSDLVAAALRNYLRARDEFWQYGDREAIYLQADILNARMIQDGADLDSSEIEDALSAYQSFIEGSEFTSLNSYPHFYYLRWHVLQHYRAMSQRGDVNASGEHLRQAERRLQWMVELDRESGNRYGQLRSRLISVLVRGIENPFEPAELTALRRDMGRNGYGFERDLLTHLIERNGEMPQIELMKIFRFYPFVHQ